MPDFRDATTAELEEAVCKSLGVGVKRSGGPHGDEVCGLRHWARETAMGAELLRRVLAGDLVVGWSGRGPTFRDPDEAEREELRKLGFPCAGER